jgi:hypothetical protein
MAKRKAINDVETDQAADAAETPEPNLAFVGRDKDGNPDPGQAVKHINDGMERIKLPDPDLQLEPFYHEHAGRICSLLPDLYKTLKPKG